LGVAEFHYNNLIHESTRVSPFYANYGFNPSFSFPRLRQSLTPASSDLLSHLSTIRSELKAELKLAQETAKLKYDVHRAPAPSFNIDKFDYRKLGPFKVVKRVGNNAYQLELPDSLSRLHPVFNINLLEPYTPPSTFPNRVQQPSSVPEVILEGGNLLKLKDIADVRKVGRRFDYLVEFLDKPASDRSWIPLSDIPNDYDELLERFHRRHTSRPRPSTASFKAKVRNSIDNPTLSTSTASSPPPSVPSSSLSSPLPPHDPLAHVPHPTTSPNPDRYTYQPPSITTTRSKRISRPRNLDRITESVTSNTPQRSSAP